MSSPTSPTYSSSSFNYQARVEKPSTKWQERLRAHCKEYHSSEPLFTDFSDQRGGRTAWTAEVTVYTPEGKLSTPARFFYHVNYLNNAREDAAECALQQLQQANRLQSSPRRPSYSGYN
ncbi:hypothetical protein L873DRAFT_1840821 [Choiromyces venosus 120613-1]|uniref:DRBM domain-containing protein n=1 Tax=Choiromyces venosus 120613-1 TaxID=1336337 RepID=A0A3N4K3A0_9PEZI|nr:hypothetical protein L873DRAFT_1840821 [Choiromyces venosus 120613-1]